jgi:hypothetical protein
MGGFFIRTSLYALHSRRVIRAVNLLSYPDQISDHIQAPLRCNHPPFSFRAAAQPLQSTIEKIFDRDDY